MSNKAVSVVLGEVRRLATPWEQLSDSVLLERFHHSRDESSFTQLVRRHGDMVFRLARRLVRDRHLAEDVFQATFLVLARDAGAIKQRDSVAAWLYSVAWRLSTQVRRSTQPISARPGDEPNAIVSPAIAAANRELAIVLAEEIQRLPESLRGPIILCYLEERTQHEAAVRLGWSKGTLRRRLQRGRDLLRARLNGRGVSLGVGLFTTVLEPAGNLALSAPRLAAVCLRFLSSPETAGASASAISLTEGFLAVAGASGNKAPMLALTLLLLVAGGGFAYQSLRVPVSTPMQKATAATTENRPGNPEATEDSFEGVWKVEEADASGKHQVNDVTTDQEWTITADRIVIQTNDGERNVWSYTTDKQATPWRIDLKHLEGRLSGRKGFGICQRKGNTLRIAYTGAAEDRPGTFEGGSDSRSYRHYVLERVRVPQDNPKGALRRLGRSGLAHENASSLAFSPDGKVLASAGLDGYVRLWNSLTGNEIKSLRCFGYVRSVVWASDGKTLYAAGDGAGVRVWDVTTGKELRRLGLEGSLSSLALSADGNTLAWSSGQQTCVVWDLKANRERYRFSAKRVYRIAISPESKTLAVGGEEKLILRRELKTGKALPELKGHRGGTYPVVFSPDGKWIASGGLLSDGLAVGRPSGGHIHLWDAKTGNAVRSWEADSYSVGVLAFTPDSKTLLSGHSSVLEPMVAWEIATGKKIRAFAGPRNGMVDSIAVSPDGKRIASAGCWGKGIYLWDVETGKEVSVFARHHDAVTALAYSGNGKFVVSASADHTAAVWEIATGKQLGRFAGHTDRVTAVAVSPTEDLVATAGQSGSVSLWQRDSQKTIRHLQADRWQISALAFSPDGRFLAGGGSSPSALTSGAVNPHVPVYLWDAATGRELRRFEGKGGRSGAVVFSPDGTTLATSGIDDKFIHLWEVKTGKKLAALQHVKPGGAAEWYFEGASSLAFSPDGCSMAALSFYENKSNIGPSYPPREGLVRMVTIWEVASGLPRQEIRLRKNSVQSIAFLDNRHLLLGCKDGSVVSWDLATRVQIPGTTGHQGAIPSLVVAPDRKSFSTGSADTTTLVWDAKPFAPFVALGAPKRNERQIKSLVATLLGADTTLAYQASWDLVGTPESAVQLEKLIPPVANANAKQIEKLITRLDSERFEDREQASMELIALGEVAETALREAIRKATSAEVVAQARRLLSRLVEPQQRVVNPRVIEVLERMDSAEARRVLRAASRGSPSASRTHLAKAALARMEKK